MLRVQNTLEDTNVKLDSVLKGVMGKSGGAMIDALIAANPIPSNWLALSIGGIKASAEQLGYAHRGQVTKHYRLLLRLHLNQIDALEPAMATIDGQVEANLGPFRTIVELIMSIPRLQGSLRAGQTHRT